MATSGHFQECIATAGKSALFQGINTDKLPDLLARVCVSVRDYTKNDMIFCIGDNLLHAGLVVSGSVLLSFLDENGNQVNMNRFSTGQTFGESFAFSQTISVPVQMEALCDSRIMFLDFHRVIGNDKPDDSLEKQLLENLLTGFARQNTFLNLKVRILGQKKLRSRIVLYLRSLPVSDHTIHLPFNREELASFLGVDRSALSRELSRMRNDRLIKTDGRELHILDPSLLV